MPSTLYKKFKHHEGSSRTAKVGGSTITFETYCVLVTAACFYCGGEGGGIDRRDSKKGYHNGNVVPSCRRCNARKQYYEAQGDFEWAIERTKAMAHRNGVPPPSQRPWAAGWKRIEKPKEVKRVRLEIKAGSIVRLTDRSWFKPELVQKVSEPD